ncbi:MAG: DUF4412 domain-containing protein [Bacteroidia bacterium]
MKKIKIILLLICFATINSAVLNAQKINEGKVVYEISYPDADIPDEQLAMMPTESSIQFKGTQSRLDMAMGMGMSMIMIFDGKEKTSTTLMDMMGSKTATKMTEQDMKEEKEKKGIKDPQVKLTDETKTIAGYVCKKAVITTEDGSFDVFYTNDIENKSQWEERYKGLNGFLMEYQMKQGPMTMKMVAKSVGKEKVDEKIFEIPADYKMMTKEEMKKMYGGGQ